MSVCTCRTMWTGAAGGGGGGGGGGATRNVVNCCLGSASVINSGIRTRMPTNMACNPKEIAAVLPRLVLSLPPDSIRLSSNIGFSYLDPTYSYTPPADCMFPNKILGWER